RGRKGMTTVADTNTDGFRIAPDAATGTWSLAGPDGIRLQSPAATVHPFGAFAARYDGQWRILGIPDATGNDTWRWHDPGAEVRFHADESGTPRITLTAPGADATAISWAIDPDEHLGGLGERFDAIEQRGKLVELWVKNG